MFYGTYRLSPTFKRGRDLDGAPTRSPHVDHMSRPVLQVEFMGATLVQVRGKFHPLRGKQLAVMVSGLTVHMLLQLLLYRTAR